MQLHNCSCHQIVEMLSSQGHGLHFIRAPVIIRQRGNWQLDPHMQPPRLIQFRTKAKSTQASHMIARCGCHRSLRSSTLNQALRKRDRSMSRCLCCLLLAYVEHVFSQGVCSRQSNADTFIRSLYKWFCPSTIVSQRARRQIAASKYAV